MNPIGNHPIINLHHSNNINWNLMYQEAIYGGDTLIKEAINGGVNINKIIEKGILHAVVEANSSAIELFLGEEDVNLDTYYMGKTPLHVAVESMRSEMASLFLNQGANPGLRNDEGDTVAEIAVINGDHEMLDILYENDIDFSGNLMHLAVQQGKFASVEFLKENCGMIDVEDEHQQIPLHIAIELSANEEHDQIAKYLIENGSELNKQDIDNRTPLHVSAMERNIEITRLLVKKGVDRNLRDNRNRTALDIAKENNDSDELIRILTA